MVSSLHPHGTSKPDDLLGVLIQEAHRENLVGIQELISSRVLDFQDCFLTSLSSRALEKGEWVHFQMSELNLIVEPTTAFRSFQLWCLILTWVLEVGKKGWRDARGPGLVFPSAVGYMAFL